MIGPMKVSSVGGKVYSAYVAHIDRGRGRPSGPLRKVKTAMLIAARAAMIHCGNPIVEAPVGRRKLLMPMSHPLPLYMACAPLYDRALPRIARILNSEKGNLVAIDVGANIGDTVALVSEYVPDAKFLCIEGSPTYFRLLTANVKHLLLPVITVPAYCGDGASTSVFPIDDHGTGRLVAKDAAAAGVATYTLDDVIEKQPDFRDANLLKIDTDGFDYRVIRGGSGLLSESAPFLYFEFDPNLLRTAGENPLSIFPFLAKLGYSHGLLYSNLGRAIEAFSINDVDFVRRAVERIGGSSIYYYDVLACHGRDATLFGKVVSYEIAATS